MLGRAGYGATDRARPGLSGGVEKGWPPGGGQPFSWCGAECEWRQNADSGTSISALSVASAMARSAAIFGRTVRAKNEAAAILPW